MAASVPNRRPDAEVTKGQGQVGLPIIGAVRTDRPLSEGQNGDWILPLIKRAQETVMSQKDAVLTMGMAKTQYIENLQGTGHLSVRRLGMLGPSFWLALMDELRDYFQINTDEERLARALQIKAEADKVISEIAMKGAKR
jgi:hypothetical protein